ncbi:MAG: DUF3108 domain-containing protein [Thiotrichales bacterium]|nr:DUF3108 domain-containing protein [Thiotrichales bacterium]
MIQGDVKQKKHKLSRLSLLLGMSFIGFGNASTAAEIFSLEDFNATFKVNAFGVELGESDHQLRCQMQNCVLTTDSKPKGMVSLFFKERAKEQIQLQQTQDSLSWQRYQKTRWRNPEDKTPKVTTYQAIEDLTSQRKIVQYPEKNRTWPWQAHLYDSTSIAYAIQWHHLHGSDFSQLNLWLQSSQQQHPIRFTEIAQAETLTLDYGNETAFKYQFGDARYTIDLWLLAKHRAFPGKIKIQDHEKNNTIGLALRQAPNFAKP